MAYRTVSWRCEKCRKTFPSYDEARSCELDHVIGEISERTQAAIAEAFDRAFDARACQPSSHDRKDGE